MSSKSIVDQIRHYQKDIERCPENSERMIRCIQRLYVLPVLVQHLQETGVGRSVNALRKYNGEVGEAAKALVTKWKAMVAAEESDDGDSAPLKESSDDSKKPPSSQVSAENGKNVKEEKSGKHESSRHSGHKRSHSSSERAEKKTSSSTDRDRKSSSDKIEKSKHDSKHDSKSSKERVKEEKFAKSSSSKDSHKSKETTEDDSDHSPSRKKRKKTCVKERRRKEMESEESSEEESAVSDRVQPSDGDEGSGNESDDDREAAETSEKGSSSEEGSSDQKHRKDRKHSSEHHKSKGSSHSSSSKHKDKNHHSVEKRDHKKPSSSSKSPQDLDKLIKENEKRVKKEKFEAMYDSSGSTPKGSSSPVKNKEKAVKVKVESNNDGIDAGSGFSFADALAGLDPSAPKKKKKSGKDDSLVKSSSSSSHNKSSSSHSHKSSKSSSSSKDHSSSSSSKKSSSSSSKKDKHSDSSMPELLKKPIKMENIELDINSTLPEINPNYRPLPHVPENVRRNSTKSATNEEEMFNMMMNKNQRTKVFSGGKSSYNQAVPSLYELCIKLLYDNIDGLEYTGGVPYDLLKPLLEKLNPDQLFVLEHYNPYLIEDTGTLWEFHCKKDFRSQKRQDMESWRELYVRCMEERENKLKALTQNISQSIAASTPVRKAKLAYVDSAVKPPRNIAKKQAKYGTGDASPIMKAHAAEKRLILNKAVVGGNDPASAATTTVPPPPPNSAPRSSWSAPVAVAPNKKRKAPLMAKALQLIKGTNRFKR